MTTRLSHVTKKLEAAWAEIRRHHPDVRPAVIVIYRDRRRRIRGHYHPLQWHTNGSQHDEVHISSLILREPINAILRTLLHEAVHSLAESREIKDTSRNGTYHNKRFAELAVAMGLVAEKAERIGHVTPSLQPGVFEQYRRVLPTWEEAQRLYQDEYAGQSKATAHPSIRLECPVCGRLIRTSRQSADMGEIACRPCGVAFLES